MERCKHFVMIFLRQVLRLSGSGMCVVNFVVNEERGTSVVTKQDGEGLWRKVVEVSFAARLCLLVLSF